MKNIYLILCLICMSLITKAQEKYFRAAIQLNETHTIQQLAKLGLEVDHGDISKYAITSDFSNPELRLLQKEGFTYKVLINDVSEYYKNQNTQTKKLAMPPGQCGTSSTFEIDKYPTPFNFSLGSMGGYFTYQQMLAQLDSMASKYPTLIKARMPIDSSITTDGNYIYWLKISDNPNTDEAEEELLYTSLHHAREPNSLSQQIYFMWYLLENYASNTEIQYLLNNNEIYFIPCINPDGYKYNELISPLGGGMWRKNRSVNITDTGVDLNRNYGFNWGYDNTGSSPNPSVETYRGDSAFSEIETQAVKTFCENRNFNLALNYHTFGNLLIYPWGYIQNFYTPDSARFVNYADFLTVENDFNYGTANQTVNYTVNGSSDDWMYGEQTTKNKILAFTPEAGNATDGFWPPSNRILPICKSNMTQNLNLLRINNKYNRVKILSQQTFSKSTYKLKYEITRLGFEASPNSSVNLTASNASITNTGNTNNYASLALLTSSIDSITITIDTTTINNNDTLLLTINNNNGEYNFTEPFYIIYKPQIYTTLLSNNCTSLSGFTKSVGSSWNTTNISFTSSPNSITDSPSGSYAPNTTSNIMLTSIINLNGNYAEAKLKFNAKWELENEYDYVAAQISTDNGITWTNLCGKYTNLGAINQILNEPIYDNIQLTWVDEEIDLSSYIGQSNVKIRFAFASDGSIQIDGFYFDDFKIELTTNLVTSKNSKIKQSFNFYPNPSNDGNFIISSKNYKSIKLTDITGKEIDITIENKNILKINKPQAGIYFAKVIDENNLEKTYKLILY